MAHVAANVQPTRQKGKGLESRKAQDGGATHQGQKLRPTEVRHMGHQRLDHLQRGACIA